MTQADRDARMAEERLVAALTWERELLDEAGMQYAGLGLAATTVRLSMARHLAGQIVREHGAARAHQLSAALESRPISRRAGLTRDELNDLARKPIPYIPTA